MLHPHVQGLCIGPQLVPVRCHWDGTQLFAWSRWLKKNSQILDLLWHCTSSDLALIRQKKNMYFWIGLFVSLYSPKASDWDQSRPISVSFLIRTSGNYNITRSSWLNCALRDDEAVFWVSIGHSEAVAVGNWWYWASRGHLCLYILKKVEIWTGVTHWQTLKDSAIAHCC